MNNQYDISFGEKMLLSLIAESDSDYDKMLWARKSAKGECNGFQGCANLGKGCDFYGFYLCTYSSEGLCDDCEINAFPERYHGCLFCRRPQNFGMCCLDSGDAFTKWIGKHTNIDEGNNHYGHSAYRLCNVDDDKEHKKTKPEFIKRKEEKGFEKWQGFYVGDKKWVIPDIQMRTTETITWDDCHNILERLLNHHGIDIYAPIQYVPGKKTIPISE